MYLSKSVRRISLRVAAPKVQAKGECLQAKRCACLRLRHKQEKRCAEGKWKR